MKKVFLGILVIAILSSASCRKEELHSQCDAKDVQLESITFAPNDFEVARPAGFPEMAIPANNPTTVEGVELGRFLFYDEILSGDGSMSCASCHKANLAFTDGKAVSKGIDGIAGTRSAMSLVNIGYNWVPSRSNNFNWDGSKGTLEEHVLGPVEDPIELHADWTIIECKLRAHNDYPERFREAFGIKNTSEISKTLAAKALAQFLRSIVSANSRYDVTLLQQQPGQFLTEDQLAGKDLFFNDSGGSPGLSLIPDAECGHCHTGSLLSTLAFSNNGLDSEFADVGLNGITNMPNDLGLFKIPTLRNIELTAPYMHDGRFQTLEEVLDHYDSGGHPSLTRAVEMGLLEAQEPMTTQEKSQIIAFLKSLTDQTIATNPAWQSPF